MTTRLHGLVLSVRNGVPPVVIDPIVGGAKVARQARVVGWPIIFDTDVRMDRLEEALKFCLSEEGRSKAAECNRRAIKTITNIRDNFLCGLGRE